VYYILRRDKKIDGGGFFDHFKFLKTSTAAGTGKGDECFAKCSSDPNCTAYGYNVKTQECTTSTADPLKDWVEDPDWDLYVRMPETSAPKSYWSDWGSCPPCGAGTRKRNCLGGGRCPGPTDKECTDQPPCDTFETVPYGYEPANGTVASSRSADTLTQCEMACLADPKCSAVYFASHGARDVPAENCMFIQNHITAIQKADDTTFSAYVRVPIAEAGKWGEMPSCGCGTVERQCIHPPCGPGVQRATCPPCAAFDEFQGLRIK